MRVSQIVVLNILDQEHLGSRAKMLLKRFLGPTPLANPALTVEDQNIWILTVSPGDVFAYQILTSTASEARGRYLMTGLDNFHTPLRHPKDKSLRATGGSRLGLRVEFVHASI